MATCNRIAVALALIAGAVSWAGCMGGDGSGCADPSLTGTYWAHDDGTGTIRGELTWPDDVPAGLQMSIRLREVGGASRGEVLPDDLFMGHQTCGGTRGSFEVHSLPAGSYEVTGLLKDNGESLEDDSVVVFEGEAAAPVEVAEGGVVEVVIELSPSPVP